MDEIINDKPADPLISKETAEMEIKTRKEDLKEMKAYYSSFYEILQIEEEKRGKKNIISKMFKNVCDAIDEVDGKILIFIKEEAKEGTLTEGKLIRNIKTENMVAKRNIKSIADELIEKAEKAKKDTKFIEEITPTINPILDANLNLFYTNDTFFKIQSFSEALLSKVKNAPNKPLRKVRMPEENNISISAKAHEEAERHEREMLDLIEKEKKNKMTSENGRKSRSKTKSIKTDEKKTKEKDVTQSSKTFTEKNQNVEQEDDKNSNPWIEQKPKSNSKAKLQNSKQENQRERSNSTSSRAATPGVLLRRGKTPIITGEKNRKRTNEELKKRSEELKKKFNFNPIGFSDYVIGRIVNPNQTYADILKQEQDIASKISPLTDQQNKNEDTVANLPNLYDNKAIYQSAKQGNHQPRSEEPVFVFIEEPAEDVFYVPTLISAKDGRAQWDTKPPLTQEEVGNLSENEKRLAIMEPQVQKKENLFRGGIKWSENLAKKIAQEFPEFVPVCYVFQYSGEDIPYLHHYEQRGQIIPLNTDGAPMLKTKAEYDEVTNSRSNIMNLLDAKKPIPQSKTTQPIEENHPDYKRIKSWRAEYENQQITVVSHDFRKTGKLAKRVQFSL